MLRKIKTILAYFKPYKQNIVEKAFIDANKDFWLSKKAKTTSEYCIVEGHVACPASIIDKARIAKAIEEVTGAIPVVYIRGFYLNGSNVAHIYNSFNINNYYMWWRGFLDPKVFMSSLFTTIKTMYTCRDGESLIDLVYKDVHVGDLIYDTLIRFRPNSYTVNKLSAGHFRLIFRAFLTFNNNERLIARYKPKYLVTSHNVYAEFGMLPRQIKKRTNGNIFLKDIYAYKCYGRDTNIKEHFLKPELTDFENKISSVEYITAAQKYFTLRMSGNIDQIDVKNAFTDKKKYNINELKKINNRIDINKKNIVVMSHAFSDAPHVGEGLLFKDYYDFLEKTLIHLNSNSSINCFVKAHPSSYMWNEKGGVEALLEKHQLTNIYIMPNDLNTNSIADFADCIVTAKGTAALEFSCLGIPAITAGKGYYAGFGITSEPDSVNKYYEMLDNSAHLERLDNDTQSRALVLLYIVAQNRKHSKILPASHILPGENFDEIYLSKYQEVIDNIANGEVMKDDFYSTIKKDVEKCNV